ncbi:hypothetical protein J6590_038510 [Homalodisca vitripennis]|nr:hypothetical protein J6590_038510 [Homalodisca vitripennis]
MGEYSCQRCWVSTAARVVGEYSSQDWWVSTAARGVGILHDGFDIEASPLKIKRSTGRNSAFTSSSTRQTWDHGTSLLDVTARHTAPASRHPAVRDCIASVTTQRRSYQPGEDLKRGFISNQLRPPYCSWPSESPLSVKLARVSGQAIFIGAKRVNEGVKMSTTNGSCQLAAPPRYSTSPLPLPLPLPSEYPRSVLFGVPTMLADYFNVHSPAPLVIPEHETSSTKSLADSSYRAKLDTVSWRSRDK